MPAYSLSNISVPKLTTTFTPPGTCLLPTFTLAPIGNDSVSPFAATTSGLDTIGASTSISRGVASECYPPEFAFATPNRVTSESTTYYLASTFSPGIICPSGYYTADQTVNEQDSNTAYGATCCPSNFILNSATCENFQPPSTIIVIKESHTETWDMSSSIYAIAATPIFLEWKKDDLSSLSTSSKLATDSATSHILTGSLTSFTSTPTTIPNSSLSTGSTPDATSTQSGLSNGAKVGLGIGIAAIGIITIFLVWFIIYKKRQRENGGSSDAFLKPELHSESLKKSTPEIAELDNASIINQLSGVGEPQELGDQNTCAELEGNWQGHEAPTDVPRASEPSV